MVSKLTRNEFTQSLQDKKIDVNQAKADQRLAGLDVAKADLNKDGKIAGAAESAALFREVDRFDNNGDSASIAPSRCSTAWRDLASRSARWTASSAPAPSAQ